MIAFSLSTKNNVQGQSVERSTVLSNSTLFPKKYFYFCGGRLCLINRSPVFKAGISEVSVSTPLFNF